ncbi:MAG TPA: biotin--[acetyl-CoA-carboxylase] ligase [Microbacteriaceae bacterium]|nr:biotin--[acetyl-CoA-carboxylase] ligase [Microbacteriaceae bacterium]
MDLPWAARHAARLCVVAESPSTNTELIGRVRHDPASTWPSLSVLATDRQSAGHGRHGRAWVAPAGCCLAASVLVRPRGRAAEPESLGWLPLVAGLAMVRAIEQLGVPVGLKWPNDVLAGPAAARPGKLVGVLAELAVTPDGPAVVLGTGVNLTLAEAQLPVPTATSLALCGVAHPDPDAVLAPYLAALARLIGRLEEAGPLGGAVVAGLSHESGGPAARGGPEAGSIRSQVREACTTLGRPVRVEAPGGLLTGTAVDIDEGGRLVVENAAGRTAVSAGDVTHLRY